ncbi:MAG: ABC transporter transmembrane domain-containing protein [Acidimicrobiales bacterium]
MTASSPARDTNPAPAPPSTGSGPGWVRRLAPFVRARRRDALLALAGAMLASVGAVLVPLVVRQVVDRIAPASGGPQPIGWWLLALAGCGLVRFTAAFLRRWFGGRLALGVQHDLRTAIFKHLIHLDLGRHAQMTTGQLLSRATSDVTLVHGVLAMAPLTLGSVFVVTSSAVAMAFLSPPLALVTVATVPAVAFGALRLRRTLFPAAWDAQQRAAAVAGVVDEATEGVRVVKGFGQEARELARLQTAAEDLYAGRLRSAGIQSRFEASLAAVPALAQVGILAVGGWMAAQGRLSLGTLLAFTTYLAQLTAPTRFAASALAMASQARAGIDRIGDLLDTRATVTDPAEAVEMAPGPPSIDFCDVRFSYAAPDPPGGDTPTAGPGGQVLNGFNLSIGAGETMALVGASGSGKSSVAALVSRLYDVGSGAVLVGGIDVRHLASGPLRRRVGVVFEQPFLFGGSVRDNIVFGRPEATDDEVTAAADAAGALGFIDGLPNGFETRIGERGVTLSGGQRQRLALARALVTSPDVLVLDDATSAVDAGVEARIHSALADRRPRPTTLLIAHRRSTLALADRIAVVAGGRVIDVGTHDQLLARCPTYGDLLAGRATLTTGPNAAAPASPGLAVRPGPGPSGTVSDWTQWRPPGPRPARRGALGGSDGAGGGGRLNQGGGVHHAITSLAPTPELLASLARLEPADEKPGFNPLDPPSPGRNGSARRGWNAPGRSPCDVTSAPDEPARGQSVSAGSAPAGPVPQLSTPAGSASPGPVPPLSAPAGSAPAGPVPQLSAPAGPVPTEPVEPLSVPAGPFTTKPVAPLSVPALVSPHKRGLGVALALVGAHTAAALAGPWLVRRGIDSGVATGQVPVVLITAGVMAVVALADWWVTGLGGLATARVAEKVLFGLRVRVFAHLQRLGVDFYERETAGGIMTRMTADMESLTALLEEGMVGAISNVVVCAGVVVAMMAMSPALALTALVVVVPLALATAWFRRRSDQAYVTARQRVAELNTALAESIAGVRVTQAFARQSHSQAVFETVAQGFFAARLASQRLLALYFPFVELLSVLALVAVLGVGSRLVVAGSLSIGELIAFTLYLTLFFSPVQHLSQVVDAYQQARAALTQTAELLAEIPSVLDDPNGVPAGRLRGDIELRGVSYRYPGAGVDALRCVDLRIAPGETVALVGPTGAGKSTVVKLLARFIDPSAGVVAVDAVPVASYGLASYRANLGYVPQEPFLHAAPLREAIAYARPDATDAEVESAARAVGAHDLVVSLPGGYHHVLGERGGSLAAGQRQLLALARARLADPAILLLDEATANLDLVSEAKVTRAMAEAAAHRTTVVVAHRLDTARRADRIVVLDGGQIVESGTHDHLVAAAGLYARMWASFSLGQEDPPDGQDSATTNVTNAKVRRYQVI